ncbi:MAG: CubicO group peptidase (beta-lactamase class C family) [Saprospiraceae bacterium]|jgi:CubicO group peptidase (beta-lactamase class C family)
MNSERFPGVSAIIVKNGEIVWLESYNYTDIGKNVLVEDTTILLLASLSKVFTGTAMMHLKENGQVN